MNLLKTLRRWWWQATTWLKATYHKIPLLATVVRSIYLPLKAVVSFAIVFVKGLIEIYQDNIRPLFPQLRGNKLAYIVAGGGFSIIALILLAPEPPPPPVIAPEDVPIEQRPTYRVGALLSLTGNYARIGNEMRRGYEYAFTAINNHGGVIIDDVAYNLGLTIYDDESSPVRAAVVAQLLFNVDKPAVLLAPYSSLLAAPAIAVANEHQAAVVVPIASSAGLASSSGKVFLMQTPPQHHLREATQFFLEYVTKVSADDELTFVNGEQPRVAVVASGDPHAQAVMATVLAQLADAGLSDIIAIDLQLADEEFAQAVEQVASVDALFIAAYAPGALRILENIAAQAYYVPFLAMTHCPQAQITRSIPTVAEGTLCALHWQAEVNFAGTDPLAKDFSTGYYQTYGSNPSPHAAAAAAAAQTIAIALQRADRAGQDLAAALATTRFPSLYGPIQFNADGINVAKPMILSQIVQSRYIPVAPPAIARQEINFVRPQFGSEN